VGWERSGEAGRARRHRGRSRILRGPLVRGRGGGGKKGRCFSAHIKEKKEEKRSTSGRKRNPLFRPEGPDHSRLPAKEEKRGMGGAHAEGAREASLAGNPMITEGVSTFSTVGRGKREGGRGQRVFLTSGKKKGRDVPRSTSQSRRKGFTFSFVGETFGLCLLWGSRRVGRFPSNRARHFSLPQGKHSFWRKKAFLLLPISREEVGHNIPGEGD